MPTDSINLTIRGPLIKAAKPKPMIANPVANPLLSGNHFTSEDTGVIYPIPKPIPPKIPYDKYNKGRDSSLIAKPEPAMPKPKKSAASKPDFLGPCFSR